MYTSYIFCPPLSSPLSLPVSFSFSPHPSHYASLLRDCQCVILQSSVTSPDSDRKTRFFIGFSFLSGARGNGDEVLAALTYIRCWTSLRDNSLKGSCVCNPDVNKWVHLFTGLEPDTTLKLIFRCFFNTRVACRSCSCSPPCILLNVLFY